MDDSQVAYVDVVSSNLAAVGYDEANQRLWVRFKSGSRYWYEGVPKVKFDALVSASSKGRYFDQHVKKAGYRFGGPI